MTPPTRTTRSRRTTCAGSNSRRAIPGSDLCASIKLPFPRAVVMAGERLPASYANFYIGNGVVVVPTFNDASDRVALNTIADLMPQHRIIGLHAVDLVWGLGTLHCLTQQEPRRNDRGTRV